MSLVYSAIVPHPPILIPSIGKENLNKLEETSRAFERIRKELIKNEVDTIFIISPHGMVQPKAFTINLSPEFHCDFRNFGDLETSRTWPGAISLAHRIREQLETKAPLQMTTEHELDHGSAVPLFLLTENLKNIKIIPLYYSGLNYDAHFKFGQLLKRELLFHKDKIAVIASGDLSHRITKDAPAGYSAKGKKFDKKFIDLLKQNKADEILKMDHELIHEAGECGLKSILILLGILDGIKHTPKMHSYEHPFGVGYLTMSFDL